MTHIYTPFVFLPLYASLEHIPRNLIEASHDLGASPRVTFFARDSSTVASGPGCWRYIRFRSVAWRFPGTAIGWRAIEHHDREYRAKPLRYSLRLAARCGDFRLHLDPHCFAPVPDRAPRETVVVQMITSYRTSRRSPLLAIYAFLVFSFLYLPIAVLILYSFNRDGVGGFPPKHFTLSWYLQLFADAPIWDSVLNSLLVATGAVVLSLTVGLLAALALDRADFPANRYSAGLFCCL